MKRARVQRGSVVFDKRRKTWNFLWCANGHRHTKLLGTIRELPTKTAALRAAEPLRRMMDNPGNNTSHCRENTGDPIPKRKDASASQHAAGRMRRGSRTTYSRAGAIVTLTDLQARPVELWLQSLTLSPKSRVHIRGLLRGLWEYAMWRGEVPIQRNPMELVRIQGATKRTRQPRSLTVEEFQRFVEQLRGTFADDRTGLCLFWLAD